MPLNLLNVKAKLFYSIIMILLHVLVCPAANDGHQDITSSTGAPHMPDSPFAVDEVLS